MTYIIGKDRKMSNKTILKNVSNRGILKPREVMIHASAIDCGQ